MADLSIERDFDLGTVGGVINSLLSAVLSSVESTRKATSSVSATSVVLSVTSTISSASLTRSASSVARPTSSLTSSSLRPSSRTSSSMAPSSSSSVLKSSSTMLSRTTSSSTPSSSSSSTPSSSSGSSTPTAIFLTSSPGSYPSSSVSALQEGVIRPSARFKTSRILIIVLSVVAGCIFLILLLFVILRRRRRYRLHDHPEDDFQPDSVGRRDLSEKPERYQGSITDEPVVRPRRFSSISKRLWQDPPKRPLTPSWGPLPTFPDSASLMTVGSHERQLTPRFEIVSRDGLVADNGSGHEARPWNLQRGYSDPMLNRPTGRAIEIAPIIIHRPSEGEIEAEQETDPEEEAEEEDKGNEDVAQREVGEEEGFSRKSVEKSSTGSTSSSVLGYYSRSLRAPHQSTSEFFEHSSSSHSFDTGTKSSSTSQPVLDHYQPEPLNDHPNQWPTPATSLLAPPPKPPKSLYRLSPAPKTQMSLTTDSRQNSGFTLDGSNPFTD